MAKFQYKKGDTVEIIAGDDKGTKAEVLQVMPKKPTEDNPKGGFVNKEMPVDASNVRKVEA